MSADDAVTKAEAQAAHEACVRTLARLLKVRASLQRLIVFDGAEVAEALGYFDTAFDELERVNYMLATALFRADAGWKSAEKVPRA